MAHIDSSELKPGDEIEVSNGIAHHQSSTWAIVTVVGKYSEGVAVEFNGALYNLHRSYCHSRRPPQKKLRPWTAETFAPNWNHQFHLTNGCTGSFSIVMDASNNGVYLGPNVFRTWEELKANYEHRPSPSSPWRACGVEVEE